MIDLRLQHDALKYRIWQHDAEYFGTLGLSVRHEGYVLYTNPGLIGRYDPNHAGMLRLQADSMRTDIQRIIAHFDALGMDSVVYLDSMHRPAGLQDALHEAGFIARVEWGQYDLLALCGDVKHDTSQRELTHPKTVTEYAQWAALCEPDPYSDVATMTALHMTECSSPAVIPTIVWCDGQPAGRCLAHIHDGLGRVECVFVDPRYRRRGLARAMVAAVASEIVAGGAIPYLFAAHKSEAERIYHAIGFTTLLHDTLTTYVRPR